MNQRLFLALWPDAKLQLALWRFGQSMQRTFGGRLVSAANIHLTLAFLGTVPVERIDELRTICASVHVERFSLDLARCGCWKRSGVAWVAPDHAPASLEALVLELRKQLAESGFPVDDKPFAPHVTLIRKAICNSRTEQPDTPFVWPVDRVVLVRSQPLRTGPAYSKIGASSSD